MRRIAAVVMLAGAALIAGCGRVDHEALIRQRAQELIGYMCADDLDGCLKLSDPIFVRAQGREAVRTRFKVLNAFIKLGKVTPDKVRVDSVKVAEDGKTADMGASIMSNNDQWKPLQTMQWVFTDGQWYLTF
jgi:hypothetical protein